MTTVMLDFLGTFSVTRDGVPIAHFRGDKVRALLTYLATGSERPHTRASLAALLWPDHDEAAALRNLSQTLLRLREAFGDTAATFPLLESTRAAIQWRGASAQVDVLDFVRLARSADPADLAQAAALYRGEFLPGFALPDADAFEEWLLLTRGQLQEQALSVFHALAAHSSAQGQWAEAAEVARRAIALDPWREAAHRQLMRALAEGGDRAAALSQFQRCRTVLAEELGIEPDEETRMLYERIQAHDLAPATPGPRSPRPNLPASLTPFTGREADLRALADLRRQGDVRLLTLLGAGGMGKTRLALEAARAAGDTYADGVYFVPLAPVTHPEAIPVAIARAIGVTLHGSDPVGALLRFLGDKQMLLVLDNLEHLPGAGELVVAILEAAPGVQIIATSRHQLGVRGEHIYDVEGLEYAGRRGGEEPSVAAQLFMQSSRRARSRFVQHVDDLAVIERIARLVQGMPLGLEMAAAWVGLLPLAAIPDEIERSLDFLQADWSDAPSRQRSMRAVFGWSWQLLGEAERGVLRRLSVFRGGFTREAAEAIAGANLRTLARLSQASLIRLHPGNGTGRYEIHELLRQFAAEQLAESEAAALHDRLAAYYLALVEESSPDRTGIDEASWLGRLDRELDNLRAALAWLLEQGESARELRLAAALRRLWYVRGHWREGARWLEAGLARADSITAAVRAPALQSLGMLANELGDIERATELLEEALALFRELGDVVGTARALNALGAVALRRGQDEQSIPRYEEALALHREAGDRGRSATILHNLGNVARRAGDPETARGCYEEALAIHQELGNAEGVAISLLDIGSMALGDGDLAGAERWLEASLAASRESHLARWIGHALLHLGRLSRVRGQFEIAGERLRESVAHARSLGDAFLMLILLGEMATLATETGDMARAATLEGAATALRGEYGIPLPPLYADEEQVTLARSRAALGEASFARAWRAGGSMSLQAATTEALGDGREATADPFLGDSCASRAGPTSMPSSRS